MWQFKRRQSPFTLWIHFYLITKIKKDYRNDFFYYTNPKPKSNAKRQNRAVCSGIINSFHVITQPKIYCSKSMEFNRFEVHLLTQVELQKEKVNCVVYHKFFFIGDNGFWRTHRRWVNWRANNDVSSWFEFKSEFFQKKNDCTISIVWTEIMSRGIIHSQYDKISWNFNPIRPN